MLSAPAEASSSRERNPHVTPIARIEALRAVDMSTPESPAMTVWQRSTPAAAIIRSTTAGSGLSGRPSQLPATATKRTFGKNLPTSRSVPRWNLFEATAMAMPCDSSWDRTRPMPG